MDKLPLLPGVPEGRVRAILQKAGGNEIASGKFASPQSSAALAVNGFGWFLDRPADLPPFPGLEDCDWPAIRVDVERQMRFPWRGGRHPWLDAVVETPDCLIGVESKRYEPFRDRKEAKLSDAYNRDVWGDGMDHWCAMRDLVRAEPRRYRHLDAAQLVKHAFGISTQAHKCEKEPVLLYLFAEPSDVTDGAMFAAHHTEIADFTDRVRGGRVRFASCSWAEWLDSFAGDAGVHGELVRQAFRQ